MLSNISWQGYWTTLAITIVLYYTFVFLFFYRKPLVQYFQRRTTIPQTYSTPAEITRQPNRFQNGSTTTDPEADAPEYIPSVHSLVDEVHAFFESVDPTFHTKESLLTSLKFLVQKHSGIKGTQYQYSVNDLIVFLAEQNGGFHLSAEEVGSVWL